MDRVHDITQTASASFTQLQSDASMRNVMFNHARLAYVFISTIVVMVMLLLYGDDVTYWYTDDNTRSGKQRLPQCIIIGVRKCGTRALLEFLGVHPDVRIVQDEVHFFDQDDVYFGQGIEWYRRRMPYTQDGQMTVEKTPAYFTTTHVPERIRAIARNVRLLLIVRDPVKRLVSDYAQLMANRVARNKTCLSFESRIFESDTGDVRSYYKPVWTGLYQRHIQRWLAVFPREQIHVVAGEQLIRDPYRELVKVERFLNLTHRFTTNQFYFNHTRGFYCMRNSSSERCLGSSKGRKHPHIDDKLLTKLKDFYRSSNEAFFNTTGTTFDWN